MSRGIGYLFKLRFDGSWIPYRRGFLLKGETLSHRETNLHDNFIVIMKFEDGFIASLFYGDLGTDQFPKERVEVFAGNHTIVIDDFKELLAEGVNQPNISLPRINKGQKPELIEFAKAIQNDTQPSVTAEDGLYATFLSHQITESLHTGTPVDTKGTPC